MRLRKRLPKPQPPQCIEAGLKECVAPVVLPEHDLENHGENEESGQKLWSVQNLVHRALTFATSSSFRGIRLSGRRKSHTESPKEPWVKNRAAGLNFKMQAAVQGGVSKLALLSHAQRPGRLFNIRSL
jgi:hypothetical protein